jgi:hypothetical protein
MKGGNIMKKSKGGNIMKKSKGGSIMKKTKGVARGMGAATRGGEYTI